MKPKKETKNETQKTNKKKERHTLIVQCKQNETRSLTKRGDSGEAPTIVHHLQLQFQC